MSAGGGAAGSRASVKVAYPRGGTSPLKMSVVMPSRRATPARTQGSRQRRSTLSVSSPSGTVMVMRSRRAQDSELKTATVRPAPAVTGNNAGRCCVNRLPGARLHLGIRGERLAIDHADAAAGQDIVKLVHQHQLPGIAQGGGVKCRPAAGTSAPANPRSPLRAAATRYGGWPLHRRLRGIGAAVRLEV